MFIIVSILYNDASVITLIVTLILASMRTSFVALAMAVFAIAQEGSDVELLAMDDIHGLISVVQVVPARRLVGRVTGPHVAKLIGTLSLRTVDTTVRPRTCADVGALGVLELVYCCSDDGLRVGLLAKGVRKVRFLTSLPRNTRPCCL